MKTAECPNCSTLVEFEPCVVLPKAVPLCDQCEIVQANTWAETERRNNWKRLFESRMPSTYQLARPDRIPAAYRKALTWTPQTRHGGLGLIGQAGAGKSSALSCLLWSLESPFLWWSGTEARDAAIDAATADKDREGAQRHWQHAMRVPILALDDISQGKMTEAWSSRLFDLLETRLGAGLPTLWTSQISVADLKAKIIRQNSGDTAQAEAISRRLSQHSMILQ